jgi:hypothetical protein
MSITMIGLDTAKSVWLLLGFGVVLLDGGSDSRGPLV